MSWRRFFRRSRADAELAQEIDLHLAEEIDENVARGISPEEARRLAYVKFGNPRRVRENLWQQNTVTALDNFWRTSRYAIRTLLRTPGFTAIAIFVMALGLGASTALFTIVRSVLLKPLPFKDPGRLVMLYEHRPQNRVLYNVVAPGVFAEWRKEAKTVEQMAILSPWKGYNVSGNGGALPEYIDATQCSWNLFSTLGVQPAFGRVFGPEDDRPDANATVVLSWSFWKRRFGGDKSIIGKDILLDAKPYTVIGVMPAWFAYPAASIQVWTPVYHETPDSDMWQLDNHMYKVVARLKPATTLAQVVSELQVVQKRIVQNNPSPAIFPAVSGQSILDDAVQDYKMPLYVLLAATGCLLLIACLNVANLLVARTAARRKEVAIRAALGGSQGRLIREQMAESLILAAAGGGLGLLLAYASLVWLTEARKNFVRAETIHIDGLVLLFVAGISLISGVLAGIIPMLGIGSERMFETLQESSRSHSGGQNRARLRKTLLACEVGLTVVLLIGAGLLLKSYRKLQSTKLGCATDNVLTMRIGLPDVRYKEPVQKTDFFEQLLARVRALPGVEAAGLVTCVPGQGWCGDALVTVAEHPPLPKDRVLDGLIRFADPGYFAAMQIPRVRGRTFNDHERLDRANVTVISQAAARQFFPGEDPIGRHLHLEIPVNLFGPAGQRTFEIVGVVGDTRYSVSNDVRPMIYWPIYDGRFGDALLTIRSQRDVESLALPVQKVIAGMDHDLPVSDVLTMRQVIGASTTDAGFNSMLIAGFAMISLVLAAVGLYGVLSYLVTQRTSEIGIRIALGAQRSQVVKLMLLDGLTPACAGLGLGLVVGGFVVQVIRSMLYGASPLDWSVFAGVAMLLSLVAATACMLPAWRASRLNAIQALRTE